MLAVKVARNGIRQNWERGHAPQATGLSHRQDPLHPAVALFVVGALHQLPPEHRKAEGPLRPVIRGFDPFFHHKGPQGSHLPLQRAGQRPRLIPTRTILAKQMHHACIPRLDLSAGGRGCSPMR
jgi:hypothetical protein